MRKNTQTDQAQFWRDPDIPALELRFSSYDSRTFPKHTHDSYSFGLVEKGECTFFLQGADHRIGPGQIALIPPAEVHCCNPDGDSGWRYRMFHLEPAWLHRLAEETAGRAGARPVFSNPVAEDAEVAGHLLRLFALLQQGGEIAEKQSAMYEAFSSLLIRLGNCRTPTREMPAEPAAVLIGEEYIRDNLENSISLETLATLTGLSPYHFLRVFKAAKGLPPHTFQTQLRIDLAKKLLSRGADIADAAYTAGFSDQCHFTRKFKQFTGATPRQYQKAGRIRADRFTGASVESQ
jgi:AraC-like DNA-binding protein